MELIWLSSYLPRVMKFTESSGVHHYLTRIVSITCFKTRMSPMDDSFFTTVT